MVLKRAHARMFNLHKHIKQSPFAVELDADVEAVFAKPTQLKFDEHSNDVVNAIADGS